jgi:8-oxo-dGTP diphosphatase
MPYTPIIATLGYVLSPDRRQVLMIHRNTRPGDHHLGKYNGLGGKVEPSEDVAAGMRREIAEEAGIDCTAMRLRGTLLEWVDVDKLDQLPMWEGDRNFLPLVFDADPRPFHGVMPYRDGRMQSWSYSRL